MVTLKQRGRKMFTSFFFRRTLLSSAIATVAIAIVLLSVIFLNQNNMEKVQMLKTRPKSNPEYEKIEDKPSAMIPPMSKNATALDYKSHPEYEKIEDKPSAMIPPMSKNATALDYFNSAISIHADKGRAAEDYCQQLAKHKFQPPTKQLGDFITSSSGKVFLIGDSLIRQTCILGSPGLCCNWVHEYGKCPRVNASAPESSSAAYQVRINAEDYESNESDWRNLYETVGRGTLHNPRVIQLEPEWDSVKDPSLPISSFFVSNPPGPNDILIAGLMGNHFKYNKIKEKNMINEKWDKFSRNLITNVVNPFPGRVVLMNYSPQHFAGNDGSYSSATGEKVCGPNKHFTASEPPPVELRNSIWDYNVNKWLEHSQTAVIDAFHTLYPLWMCHRTINDCTHWNDSVYSLLAGLVSEGLASIS